MTEKLNGVPLASLTAAGIGCFALGTFTVLAEAFPKSVKPFLTLSTPVGPLSGKTSYAVLFYLLSWTVLYFIFRKKNLNETFWITAAFVLVSLGILMTFPLFYQLFTVHA